MNRPTIEIYVDGACSGNPGPGGYAAILIRSQLNQTIIKKISGYVPHATNNRMELYAVVKALLEIKQSSNITIYTDSMYVYTNGQKEKMFSSAFRNTKKKIINLDLWDQLYFYHRIHQIQIVKVKAHDNNAFNNECDYIAKNEILKNKTK